MAGRPESSRRCTCKLETYPHLVPQREWADHRAARSRLETQAHAAVADSVAESVAHAALSEGANESNSIPADTTQIGQEALKALQAIMSARSTKPKQPTRQKQDDHLLMTIAKKIEETIVSVEQSSNTSLEAQRQAANAAWYEGVLVAAASLQNIKPSPEKSFVEERLKVLEILVKDLKSALPEETEPFFYDSAYTRVNPVAKLNVIAQVTVLLGLVCHFLLRLAEDSVNFILGTAMILVKATMALDVKMNDDGSVEFDEFQNTILKDIPKSLHIAMSRLNLDGKTVMYAACPSCNHIHPPDLSTSDTPSWPDKCQNTIVGKEGRSVCGAALLRRGKASSRPIKPFLAPCFLDYLARLLSDPENERMMDEVCDDAVNTKPSDRDFVQDVFQAEFVQSFKDRDGIVLFIKRAGKRMRLLFSISMDFFPPFGSRKRSNSNSIGLIKVSCLNLRLIVRDKPENVFVVVVPGPSSPSKGEINPYLRPIIDVAVVGWNRGIHFSSTGTEPDTGRIVDLAFVLSANDLPAARQLAGAAAHNAHIYCTCCQGRGRSTVYNTDFSTWNTRDRDQMRSCAEAWRDAETLAEREQIYQEHGIRWSEMWRLPYWDPTRMLPPDPMHTVLEGLVHYHCRRVLKLNLLDAKKFDKSPPAYQYDFPSLDAAAPADWDMTKDIHQKSVEDIYKLLVYQISENEDSSEDENGEEDDEGEEEEEAEDEDVRKAKAKAKAKKRKRDKDELTSQILAERLERQYKISLAWVCYQLELPKVIPSSVPPIIRKNPKKAAKTAKKKKKDVPEEPLTREKYLIRVNRAQLAKLLVDWRLDKPWRDSTGTIPIPEKVIDEPSLRFVQQVIANTTTPAWVNHVPKNYGEKKAGSMKADEWRLLITIYLPIALVLLWGEDPKRADLLNHTMALVQATTLVCRFSSTPERALACRTFIKEWLDNLYSCYPHTRLHAKKTIVHIAFHIYEFLLLFGPVLSWWCFPVERLIGVLQKFNSNSHVGGEHEATVVKTWMRSANLRRWLNRKDCPELLRQFHRLYSMYVASADPRKEDPDPKPVRSTERAHFDHKGLHFSRASTHLGNSLVSFLDSNGDTVFGSIEQIQQNEAKEVKFVIRPQAPLPPGVKDPFRRFIHFPARLYSSKMADSISVIEPSRVIGHYARFIWKDRAVVLDLSRG